MAGWSCSFDSPHVPADWSAEYPPSPAGPSGTSVIYASLFLEPNSSLSCYREDSQNDVSVFFHQILFSSPRWPRCPLPAPGHLSQSFCSFVVSFCTWHRNSETHRSKTTTKPCKIDIQCHWHSTPKNPQACSSCEAHLSSSIIFSCLCCSWQIWVWKNIHSTPNGKSNFDIAKNSISPKEWRITRRLLAFQLLLPFLTFFSSGIFLKKKPGFSKQKTIRFEPDSLGGLGPNPLGWWPGPETWFLFSPPVASSIFFVALTVVLAHKFWKWKYVDQVIIVSLNQATHQMIWNHVESLSIFTYQPASIESSPQNNPSLVTSSAPLLAEWLVPSPAKKGLLASSSSSKPADFRCLTSRKPVFSTGLLSLDHLHLHLLQLGLSLSENINTSTTWWHLETLPTPETLQKPPFPSFGSQPAIQSYAALPGDKKRTKFSRHLLKDSNLKNFINQTIVVLLCAVFNSTRHNTNITDCEHSKAESPWH